MKSHNDFIKQLYNQANVSVYTLHTEQSCNQSENGVCCDTVHGVHKGILYVQNVICFYSTHNYFIYAHKESKAFPESSFARLINAQQCYVCISYPISPKSDNKCEKYGYKFIYTSKWITSFSVLTFKKFLWTSPILNFV